MGGLHWKLPRMPRAPYLKVEAAVVNALVLEGVSDSEFRVPRYFPDKEDFGDLDVLVRDDLPEGTLVRVLDRLGVSPQHRARLRHGVLSAIVDGLQVDFFSRHANILQCSADFMDFGDVGNIVGRMARRLRLKWGAGGLAYVFRWGDHYKRERVLSQDFREVCGLLGLEYEPWRRGFLTQLEMFEWVTRSPFFSSEPYLREDGPIAARASRRSGMRAFVEFVRGLPERAVLRVEDPVAYVEATFPNSNLSGWIGRQQAHVERVRATSEKFNGRIVMVLRPGLVGKELGAWIGAFRKSRPDFDDWVAGSTVDEVNAAVVAFEVP